jgi:predicted deacetylase
MLVVPDHWDEAPIAGNHAFAARLRFWADAGVEMFVHGWRHRDDSVHHGHWAGWKARHMTAGEGEFLGLDYDEAAARMARGRDLIEQATGRPVAGFIAPAWLYGPGALAAVADLGFVLAEDHLKVWSPASGRVLARGPVVTWASRSRPRAASSLAFAALARRALAPVRTVRIAVHPGDAGHGPILRSIARTLGALAKGRTIGRYRDLVDAEMGTPRHP